MGVGRVLRFARIWTQFLKLSISETLQTPCNHLFYAEFQGLPIGKGFEVVRRRIRKVMILGQDLGCGCSGLEGSIPGMLWKRLKCIGIEIGQ